MSLSSHNYNRRGKHNLNDYDRSDICAGQAIVTVVNDPRVDAANRQWSWLSRPDNSWQEPPPPLDPHKYPAVTRADLKKYLELVHGKHDQFLADRQSLEEHHQKLQQLQQQEHRPDGDAGTSSSQGDGLAKALVQVPPQFFREDFSLSRPEIFQELCECSEDSELQTRLEKHTNLLDIVETQLMREISSRSASIFMAAGSLHDLNSTLCSTLEHIRLLRKQVSSMDEHTYSLALKVMRLQKRRKNLEESVELLKGLDEINSSKAALQCLLDGQDYAGALELLEHMRHIVGGHLEDGLKCFRSLPPQVTETMDVVEQLLAHEFRALSQRSDVQLAIDTAVSEATAQVSRLGDEAGSSSSASSMSGSGMLRSNGSYRQLQLSTASSAAASSSNGSGGEAAAAREQLHDRLLPVVVGLYRADKLLGAVQQLREHRCSEVKAVIKEIIERMLEEWDEGGAMSSGGGDGHLASLSERLQMLTPVGFIKILLVISRVVDGYMSHALMQGSIIEEILKGLRAGTTTAAAVRKETGATLQAMADVAQGRWVKLLSARTTVHTRLKLYEFQALVEVSEGFAALPEQSGGKGSAALRATVQLQCRAYLEAMHQRCVTQLQHLLESEQWVPADVPPSFQAITDRLVARCKALSEGLPMAEVLAALTPPMSSSGSHIPGVTNGASSTPAQKGGNPHPSTSNNNSSSSNHSKAGSSNPHNGATNGSAASQASHRPPHTQGRQVVQISTLSCCGKNFHCVNSVLILIKVLEEYLSLHDVVPLVGVDIAHRTVELLKTFNSQSCSLVLGAGAMRSAGLKSISAKHLALSCQCLNLLLTLQPLLRGALVNLVAAPRRALLLPEFDRLMNDLTLHMDEIHSKLVDIMQDRLIVAAKQLVVEADGWAVAANTAAAAAAAAAATAAAAESEAATAAAAESAAAVIAAASAAAEDPLLTLPPPPSQPTPETEPSLPHESLPSTDSATNSTQEHHPHPQSSMPSASTATSNGSSATSNGSSATSNGSSNHPPSNINGDSSFGATVQENRSGESVSKETRVTRVGSQSQLQPRLVFPVPFLPPAESIRLLSKQLSTLRSVLAPILQVEEVQYIFGRVASVYSETLSGTLDLLQPRGCNDSAVIQWEAIRRSNTLFILQCFSELPLDPNRSGSYLSRLSTFYTKHYGMLPDTGRPGVMAAA